MAEATHTNTNSAERANEATDAMLLGALTPLLRQAVANNHMLPLRSSEGRAILALIDADQRLEAPSIADLLRMHQAVADTLDASVPGQNDFRFALLGVVTEVAEAIQHLPWRPWRTADRRPPTAEELDAAIPELADALGALLRGVVNLGIDPERFEQACVEHIAVKFDRIRSGRDG